MYIKEFVNKYSCYSPYFVNNKNKPADEIGKESRAWCKILHNALDSQEHFSYRTSYAV